MREKLCRGIPFVILYFVIFDIMLFTHENFSDASQVERNLRGMLSGSSYEGYAEGPPGSMRLSVSGHKVLRDIATVEDVYTYLREAIIPQIIPGPGSAPLDDGMSRLLRYNLLVGGLQLEQVRTGKEQCSLLYPDMGPKNDLKVNPLLEDFFCFRSGIEEGECFGPGEAVEGFCPSTRAAWGRSLRSVKGFPEDSLKSTGARIERSTGGPRYSLIMYEHQGTDVALRRLEELVSANWIDEQSTWVGVKFFTVNPDLGVYSLSRVNVFLLETGQLLPRLQVSTFMADPYQYRSTLVMDVLWAVLLLKFLLNCMWDLARALHRRGSLLRTYVWSLWTWINWACVVLGLVAVILWVVYLGKLDAVQQSSLGVAINRPPEGSNLPRDSDVMRTYVDSLQILNADIGDLDSYLAFLRFFLGCYNLLLVARFFEAFQAQPRLALVTNTILECFPDFLHFMMVFVTMLVSFAVAATFLFGHRVLEFSRVGWSIERCLFMLLGSLDYNKLSAEHPISALVWFVLFMTLMFMVMLNMLLAVIIDVYTGQMGAYSDDESIWHQLGRRMRSKELPARKVLQAVREMSQDEVSSGDLLEACPGLGKRQADELIQVVEHKEDREYDQVTSLTDATGLAVAMKEHVKAVGGQVNELVALQQRTKRVLRRASLEVGALRAGPPRFVLEPKSRQRIKEVERRLDLLEQLLDDVLRYTENRGRGLRDRLRLVEEHLRLRQGQADDVMSI